MAKLFSFKIGGFLAVKLAVSHTGVYRLFNEDLFTELRRVNIKLLVFYSG